MRITVTGPDAEPITLDEAKEHLRVIHGSDDALIERLITAAREHVENETGRALVAATYRQHYPVFDRVIGLPLWPVVSVASVTYASADGTRVAVDPLDYLVDADWSFLAPRGSWPRPATSVVVEFTTEPREIPESLRQAVLLRVQADYEADADDAAKLRTAAHAMAFPHRMNLGV